MGVLNSFFSPDRGVLTALTGRQQTSEIETVASNVSEGNCYRVI
jgi:hypothetical protein